MPQYSIPRRTSPAPINWRRGMFRIWILLSIAWLMAWLIYFTIFGIQGGFKAQQEYLAIPVTLIGPPIALLLFGMAAGWAFRGFRPNEDAPGS